MLVISTELVLKFFLLENEFFLNCCVFGIINRLWALQFGVQFLMGARDFYHLQNVYISFRARPSSYFVCITALSLWCYAQHPPPCGTWFEMSGTVCPLLLWAFLACIRTALSFAASQILYKGGHFSAVNALLESGRFISQTFLVITVRDTSCFPKHCNSHLVPQAEHWSADPTRCLTL